MSGGAARGGVASSPAALEIENLSKTFGGVRALDRASLTVRHGEIHGLLGQNGSGKSTLIKILAGFHEPDPGGRLRIAGQPVELPLRLEEHTDRNGHVTSTLREWKRHDWGDAGHDFHWWCTSERHAFVGSRPVYEELRDEITEIVEPHIYPLIVKALEDFDKRRVNAVPLPHPAVRRRS